MFAPGTKQSVKGTLEEVLDHRISVVVNCDLESRVGSVRCRGPIAIIIRHDGVWSFVRKWTAVWNETAEQWILITGRDVVALAETAPVFSLLDGRFFWLTDGDTEIIRPRGDSLDFKAVEERQASPSGGMCSTYSSWTTPELPIPPAADKPVAIA